MKIHILILLTLLLSLDSCFSPNHDDIIGKWKIVDKEKVGQYIGSADELKNSSFFGAELWSKAVGKSFEFRKDGHVDTNLAEVDMSDVIELTYSVSEKNDKITFKATNLKNPQNDVIEFFVEIKFTDKDTMFWTLDGLYKIKLERTE